MFVLLFIAAIAFFIMFHEFGHFATAKAFGMKAEKFFLGFGPTIWSVRKGETEYGVKAIPAGGFVKITGMSRYEEIDPADRGRTFHEKPAWQRAIVLSAGSFTHFVVAVVLLFAGLAFVGLPAASNGVEEVTAGSPAQQAGLQPGDAIVAVDGEPTADFLAVRDAVQGRANQTVEVEVLRDGARLTVPVAIGEHPEEGAAVGFLGVAPQPVNQTLPVGEALRATFVGDFSIVRLTQLSIGGIASALSPSSLVEWASQIGQEGPRTTADGPISLVGAGDMVNTFGRSGDLFAVLVIFINLNIVLGALNMLPLPPLDGGHLAVLLTEKAVNGVRRMRGAPANWHIDPAALTPIALAVILFFGLLFVVSLYLDIVKPASTLLQ